MAETGPKPTEGWVYIIHNPAWPGFVKIGSARDISERLRHYQTGSPFRDYTVVGAAPFADRMAAERSLHETMRGHRVGSTEWHQIHPEDARHHLERLTKLES